MADKTRQVRQKLSSTQGAVEAAERTSDRVVSDGESMQATVDRAAAGAVIGTLGRDSSTFDPTNNWREADGPPAIEPSDGRATDSRAGTTATGSGDAVSGVHCDPHSTSPLALGWTGPRPRVREDTSRRECGERP